MRKHTVDYYDWIDDVGPAILVKLNQLLVAKGVDPLEELHGGTFKDGKWVGVLESEDYRNYWHAYLHLWGENLNNDSFQVTYFADPDDDEQWEYCIKRLREWAVEVYKPADPNWTDDLVIAVRGMVRENFTLDEYGSCKVLFWWCW